MFSGDQHEGAGSPTTAALEQARAEIARLRCQLHEAEEWNRVLENSLRFRLGRILVDAMMSPAAAAALPRNLGSVVAQGFREQRERRGLLKHGYPLPAGRLDKSYDVVAGRALYLLHSALPQHHAGYTLRSHNLLCAMRSRGMDVHAATRLGYPGDLAKRLGIDPEDVSETDEIDGIVYRHLLSYGRNFVRKSGPAQIRYLDYYAERVASTAKELGISLIHAASNYQNGIAGAAAARRLGIPFLYEVRGFWELSLISRMPEWEGSPDHRLHDRLEKQAAAEADAVVTLNAPMRRELIARGIDGGKIATVPNGVDPDRFVPRGKNPDLVAHYALEGKVVIGYVGTVVRYEGLDLLVRAVAALRAKHPHVHLLIIGGGSASDDIAALVRELGVGDMTSLVGQVPPERIPDYYSLIDIAPFPRKGVTVCELVSPMKPLEAMAMEKAVVVSSVAALAEMVRDGETGLVHAKDEAEDLAGKLERLIADPALRQRLGRTARRWVAGERTWRASAAKFSEIYNQLLER